MDIFIFEFFSVGRVGSGNCEARWHEGGLGRCKISFGHHKAHLYLVVGLSGSQNWARSVGFHNLIITYILFFIFFRPKQLIAYIPFTLRFFNLHLSRFIGLMPNSPLLSHLSPFIRSPNLPLPTQEIIFNLQSTLRIEYRALFFLEIILPFDRRNLGSYSSNYFFKIFTRMKALINT